MLGAILVGMSIPVKRNDVARVDAAELVVILGTLAVGLLLIGLTMTVGGSSFALNQWAVLVITAGVIAGVGAAILWGVGRSQGHGAA